MGAQGDVSVVLCAYTESRWHELVAAVASVARQTVAPREIIVAVDNNAGLLARVAEGIRDVRIVENVGVRGAGQTRNRGVEQAVGEYVAFLDDDATAAPTWIESALSAFEDPLTLGVGGAITPAWQGRVPRWLAPEFYWTVGCTYAGVPTSRAAVRNLIATNMFVRREAFNELGGFRAGFGKTGARSGAEETELCIRASQRWPGSSWIYDPSVVVSHEVPRARARLGYFLRRCYDEGVAKASIVDLLGARDGLAAERTYARRTLPSGFIAGLRSVCRTRQSFAAARSLSILVGAAATGVGYAVGRAALTRGRLGARERGAEEGCERILVVGSGTHFISGVSHYTRYVADALSERVPVSVILMRRLIPRRLYPGSARVGDRSLTEQRYSPDIPVYDGVDWFWLPSMLGAIGFILRERPRVVLFQWWTGAVLHSYLLLALVGHLLGARIIIEVHEIQDSGEAGMAPARSYVRRVGRRLMGMADGYIVHSEFDRGELARSFPVAGRPVRVVRHGPYSHYAVEHAPARREAPREMCNILFFGTIRPYKGLEDLVRAFEALAGEEDDCWLTVVGETWENWTEPISLIESSRFRDRITLVNRYVSDAEASGWFAGADIVALPYRRSSASGPLHLTMDAGLPVVVGDVGGLRDAAAGYDGAILVAPRDPDALREALRTALALRGVRFRDPSSWSENVDAILALAQQAPPQPRPAHA
ncbi:MAG TPA: glycosyltransferase [Solirubrobacteraceae bacterium]|jgi:glycosyltransferase involved in cell wall biosynthesis